MIAHRFVKLRRFGAAGRAAGSRGVVSSWRRLNFGVETVPIFASLTLRRLDDYASLRSGCVDFFTSLIVSCLDTTLMLLVGLAGKIYLIIKYKFAT